MYGLNEERTRYLDAPGVKPPFTVRWRFKGGHLLEYSPILVSNQLFGINNNGLAFAIKTQTGKARWKRQIASLNASAPTFSDDILYISNLEPGQVIALATYDGHTFWKHPLPGRSESSPAGRRNKVIVGCECNTVYAFNKKTGKTIWERHVNGAVKAAPAYSDGIVYVGDYSGEMTALHVNDGSIKWQTGSQGTSFGRTGQFYATAAVAFGRVYAGNTDGRMYSFDQDTGRPRLEPLDQQLRLRRRGGGADPEHRAHRLLRLLRRQLLRARRPHRRRALEPVTASARSPARRA